METVLYLVATPIGNLGDLTYRAAEVLAKVDLVLAEDTRTSGVLLKHYGISTPMKSYHAFNEHNSIESIIADLRSGKRMALISDAGTPGISDPGFLLVREALSQDIKIEVLPGATAFLPALIKSGFPCDRFTYEGFLPHKKGRKTRLESLKDESRTIILYESPHRLLKLLGEIRLYIGEKRRVSASRELTKKFEETITGSIHQVITHFENRKPKGEFVVVIEGTF